MEIVITALREHRYKLHREGDIDINSIDISKIEIENIEIGNRDISNMGTQI